MHRKLEPGDMCINDGAVVTESVHWIDPGSVMFFLNYCSLSLDKSWMGPDPPSLPDAGESPSFLDALTAASVLYRGELTVVYPASRLNKYEERQNNA